MSWSLILFLMEEVSSKPPHNRNSLRSYYVLMGEISPKPPSPKRTSRAVLNWLAVAWSMARKSNNTSVLICWDHYKIKLLLYLTGLYGGCSPIPPILRPPQFTYFVSRTFHVKGRCALRSFVPHSLRPWHEALSSIGG